MGMEPPRGYYEAEGWWMWGAVYTPTKSVFPDAKGGPGWAFGDIPSEFSGSKADAQGWKLHVCVQPGEIEGLFVAISPLLRGFAHKFAPFDTYRTQVAGYAAHQLIGTKGSNDAAGKACAIYPSSPAQIPQIVSMIDQAIRNINILLAKPIEGKAPECVRPYPGGVKGDLALGSTGFVYTRYGGFYGKLAKRKRLYDPIGKTTCADPRFIKPYPDFIKAPPNEISGVRRA